MGFLAFVLDKHMLMSLSEGSCRGERLCALKCLFGACVATSAFCAQRMQARAVQVRPVVGQKGREKRQWGSGVT